MRTSLLLLPLLLTACTHTPDVPPMDKPGTYYHVDPSAAGTYETDGPYGSTECVWQRWRDPHDQQAIETGQLQRSGRIDLHAGDYFVSYGCQPWHTQ